MDNKFKQALKVQKSPIELSDEIQFGLANNEEYDNMTDELCMAIYNYFLSCNPNVAIENPRKRIKSPKSIHEKSKSRELERLSKLYIIEGLKSDEIEELYKIIKIRIQEKEQINEDEILSNIKILLKQNIEELDIEEFLNNIMVDKISDNTKKALLRILKSKIEKSNIKGKRQILNSLDERCGKKAAEKSGNPEDNKIQYESIEAIRKDKDRIQLLYDKVGYLKSEDLIGTKIVISDKKYNDKEMKIIATKFINKLIKDKKFLQENGIEVIPFSLKHKSKKNGYEAEHVKFRFVDKPEYTLELQIKSAYVENLSRGKGEASHENRPGKKRELPNLEDEEKFKKEVKNKVPRYTIFHKENGVFKTREKCSMRKNVIAYYESELPIEMYKKIYEFLPEDKCI